MSSDDINAALAHQIKSWASELGFQQTAITDTNLADDADRLRTWLQKNYHGQMQWLAENFDKRTQPEQLLPGTLRVICVRMNYLPGDTQQIKILKNPEKAYISRYALGRDYHKLMRRRLAQLTQKIRDANPGGSLTQRPFVDSAPVMERALAAKAGIGWIGKHTLVLNRDAGSWYFLGEIYTSLLLPVDNARRENHCGTCTACLKVCPTDAFPRPYELDARRCISYLTIENKGPIPLEFREPMGNRVFGCDDCQAICPWNKFAQPTDEVDFQPRHNLHNTDLLTLFNWSEQEFLANTAGSPIRRIGYESWLRNLAVGLGNAPPDIRIIEALQTRRNAVSTMVQEHIDWALHRQNNPHLPRRRKIRHHQR